VPGIESVWTPELNPADARAFDDFIGSARGGHFSQTRAWARVEVANRPTDVRFFLARRGGCVVGAALVTRRKLPLGIGRFSASALRGPVCDRPEDLSEVLEALLGLVRRDGAVRFAVMPYWSDPEKNQVESVLRRMRFKDVQRPRSLHVRSLRVDLSALPWDDPFSGPEMRKVRHEIRRAERAGGSARPGERRDLQKIREWHEERLQLQGNRVPARGYFDALGDHFLTPKEHGAFFVCERAGEPVSAVFVARSGGLASYVIGDSDSQAVAFPKLVLPIASAIAWAKAEGLSQFDLGGISMRSHDDEKYARVADFKRSFSRTEIEVVGRHARWF